MTQDRPITVEAWLQEPWRIAGGALGREYGDCKQRARQRSKPPDRRRRVQELFARAVSQQDQENAAWVLDNFRLIAGAERAVREFSGALPDYPVVIDAQGRETARVCVVARGYLATSSYTFREEDLAGFIDGYQCVAGFTMSEIWALELAIQMELIDRLTESAPGDWPSILTCLRKVAETVWKDVFEIASSVNRVLMREQSGVFPRMDAESRDRYRRVVGELARRSGMTETGIAESALELSQKAPAGDRRHHIGYYLVDSGRPVLEEVIGYRPPWRTRLQRLILRYPTVFYLTGIELLTILTVCAILSRAGSLTPAYAALLFLALPATQAAADFMNNLTAFLLPPRVLSKLDFSEGIPDDCVTMVAVPALLLNEAQVRDLALDLEIRFLANRDPNLYFALLTDPPDSDRAQDERDALVGLCARLIEALNQRYCSEGRSPFFLFHRQRIYNQQEGCWMAWERKRGKLLDLNQLLRGRFDAFPVKVGDLAPLPKVRYVITLDTDTQLPRDSAARLAGAIAHPLNRALIDPARRVVVEGYGILQPRIGISVQSAARSRLAALYSGQTGFDIYTHAVSDVYQDLFGEGIFTGKGIYDVDALSEVLDHRFPDNALLSHDLIEGAYARAALASDIELIDDYPSHFSAYSRRKHRWVRGDWQIMRWTSARVRDYSGRLIANPIALISQWKILDNLRRSLLEPALLLLLVSGWLWLPGKPAFWTAVTIAMWCVPMLSGLFFALLNVPGKWRAVPAWLGESARSLLDNALLTASSLIFLLHQALVSMDAIVRAVLRVLVTRQKMLEWETAAEAAAAAGLKATVDVYLEWTPAISMALAMLIWLVRPQALASAAPLLALWAFSYVFSAWLNRRPRAGHSKLSVADVHLLRESADRIWRFFPDWSTASTNWLIPDSVREDGGAELRVSPTNLGMLLDARIAAVHLGIVPLAEFVFETQQTLERIEQMPKHRGHPLNWVALQTLKPLAPLFVSTVDSGNLAASLWTLRQAALAFAAELPVKRGLTKELAAALRQIADISDRLVRDMDFRFLYHPRKKSLSVGYDVGSGKLEAASYNLLASEARMAGFVAIAKGDIPQEAWFQLGRAHTLACGEPVLLSWSGTMFEYLMPSLWMRNYRDTIVDRSCARPYAHSANMDGAGVCPGGFPNPPVFRLRAGRTAIGPLACRNSPCGAGSRGTW